MAEHLIKMALVLMAAGSSRRMGKDKLFLEINQRTEPETLLEHSLKLMGIVESQGKARDIHWICQVVYQSDRVKEQCKSFGVSAIFNEKAALGQSESVKLGAAKALELEVQGICFMTADQPNLEPGVLHRLAETFAEVTRREGRMPDAVVPTVDGEWLSPVVIGAQCLEALMQLKGDQGAKAFLKGEGRQVIEIPFEDLDCFIDLDTPEDYLRFR